nr:zinc finger, CCHC-type [Tanacetum cinerariifolium]
MGNNTWVLADLPSGCKPLGCKWIFKRKLKVDETIEKFKARLVIQGFKQKSKIDYFDTNAPVARISTIRLLIAMTSIHNLIIYQMDVKTTFLNDHLDEEVYMNQPLGFIMPDNENKVCKLIKSLYGLKQAPKQNMNTTQAQQKALDDALVTPSDRLEFEKCNMRLKTGIKRKEAAFQVVLVALALTHFYRAFLITVDDQSILWGMFHKKNIDYVPLSLIQDYRGRQIIPKDYFNNKDLEYIKGGDLSRKYSTSVTKTKAATYELKWIKDLVPKLWSPVMLKYRVTHRLSSVYHPQTSGQVEFSNHGLKSILERTVGENQASWSDKLDDALWAFRTTFKTPIRIALGYEDPRAHGFVHPGSESRPPILNKENYMPWSSRLLRYAKSRPNGKLIQNSILNGPYVRRMIPETGDANRDVNVTETFHEQTDDELSEKELKQI